MTLFDAYAMADWSAAAERRWGEDSIWIAVAVRRASGLEDTDLHNPPTRSAATRWVRDRIAECAQEGLRVLLGFDFPYGHPRGLARALGAAPSAAPRRYVWGELSTRIRDDEQNRNNRFEVASSLNAEVGERPGPFWGCPERARTAHLGSKSCGFPYRLSEKGELARLRTVEQRLKGTQESWKLYGQDSVGSQALVGIPCVQRLRDDAGLAAWSRVWPFETGFTPDPSPARGPFVLHAEIWPGVVPLEPERHAVRDAAQVLTLAHHLARLDEQGKLGALFDLPKDLDPATTRACIAEEGWILGA